jgi:uncharacterized low-complexity protein
MTSKKKTIGVMAGSAFVAGMALAPLANAAENPFALQSLQGGYMVAADTPAKAPEAKCGQGKCGGMKTETAPAKATEAKCGQGKCGGMKTETPPKNMEAKCGQGKCGGMNMKKM